MTPAIKYAKFSISRTGGHPAPPSPEQGLAYLIAGLMRQAYGWGESLSSIKTFSGRIRQMNLRAGFGPFRVVSAGKRIIVLETVAFEKECPGPITYEPKCSAFQVSARPG
jgi:hypothetical protein